MSLFHHDDYRAYLRAHLKQLPRKGRGELSKMANSLGTNSTLMSQVLGGSRDFNSEQTYSLSRYLGHTELELEYFSLLVQKERAGSHDLRLHLERRLAQIREDALKLSKRISHDRSLNNLERAVFYSSWVYSAVHLFTSLRPSGATVEETAEYFDIPRFRAAEVLRFLAGSRLVAEEKGRYCFAVQSTFVEKGSPFLIKHHTNWRIQAIQKSEALADGELMYTGQFSLSLEDFQKLREKMAEFLKSLNQTVKDSPAERLAAFNMDWFWIEK